MLDEEGADLVESYLDGADEVVTSRITYAEVRAALAAAVRGGRHSASDHRGATRALDRSWEEVLTLDVTDPVVRLAGALTDRHRLRGFDAVHVASAMSVRSRQLLLLTLDREVAESAVGEGVAAAPALT